MKGSRDSGAASWIGTARLRRGFPSTPSGWAERNRTIGPRRNSCAPRIKSFWSINDSGWIDVVKMTALVSRNEGRGWPRPADVGRRRLRRGGGYSQPSPTVSRSPPPQAAPRSADTTEVGTVAGGASMVGQLRFSRPHPFAPSISHSSNDVHAAHAAPTTIAALTKRRILVSIF